MELTQFIRGLQVVLLEKYDWAREQKERSIQQLFAAVRTSMKYSRISDDQLMMLDNFGLAGDDAFSAKLLRAEDLYRSCDFEIYDGFVNALPYEEQRKVKEKQGEFSKDLRRDLSDPKGTFDSEYLTSAHQSLSGAKRSNPFEKTIFCYLCIRLDRNVEYRLEKESLARCDPEGAQEVENFLHCFRNCRMNEVYHAVRLGKKLDPAWYDWQDDLGLTVLHYAILLKKEELVTDLLDKREWFSQTSMIDSRAMDYGIQTYQTNVMGTINIMEAIHATKSVKVGVMITTDKCYDNKEQLKGYVETDPFGGYDPYSSSKGACEIAIQSWRRSFFNPEDYGKKHTVSIASVRAGNVIGGGDWAKDRIIPDCIRALETTKVIDIRSPKAVRPWEHVLEPLSGYMLLAQKMWEKPTEYCEGWNFGPEAESVLTVWEVASAIIESFGFGELKDVSDPNAFHEANLLMLNIEKAKIRLGWKPRLNAKECAVLTSDWYKRYKTENVYEICLDEINKFIG